MKSYPNGFKKDALHGISKDYNRLWRGRIYFPPKAVNCIGIQPFGDSLAVIEKISVIWCGIDLYYALLD